MFSNLGNQICYLLLLFMCLVGFIGRVVGRYEPTWESIDSRPLPAWYDNAKFGIFVHWGVFSVPSYGNEWFWWYWKGVPPFVNPQKGYVDYMKMNYSPRFTYADFAKKFSAELYNPDYWAEVFKASGAKYVVLTTKHHEGFCNWNTSVSFNWNSVQVGPKRDLTGELAAAIRSKTDIHFGVYHSLYEWYNELYLEDSTKLFEQNDYVRYKIMPELRELVEKYHPDVIWSDGDAASPDYWNSTHFLAWLYNDSPVKDTVVTNDRWGYGTACKHGGYFTCHDGYNPRVKVPYKFENCMSVIKGSWGNRRDAYLNDFQSVHDLLDNLVSTVSCGGNLLLNVGPSKEGTIPPIQEERLRQLGSWLDINGAAIYNTTTWLYQNDTKTPNVWFTVSKTNKTDVFATLLDIPAKYNTTVWLAIPKIGPTTTLQLLGCSLSVSFTPGAQGTGVTITLPPFSVCSLPYAWVFKFTNLIN